MPPVLRTTLEGLLAPRRLLPIVVILAPLLFVQWRLSLDAWALPLGAAMSLAFLLVAPALWRFLFPLAGPAPVPRGVGLAAYFVAGVAVVYGVGRVFPSAAGMRA